MASKLIPLLATLLLVAHASAAFRATVTTFDSSDYHRYGGGRDYPTGECRREVMSQNLRPCMQFLNEQEHRSYGGDVSLSGRGSRPFYECCNELESIRDYSCRCQGLRMQMEKMMGGQREARGWMSTAENLPRMCGIGPDSCRFSQSRWF